MPKGHYETAERVIWTLDRIREAVSAFQASRGRPPRLGEWQAAYGLPNRRTVERLCGTLSAALAVLGLPGEAPKAPAERPYHFGSGTRRRRHGDT